jgi:diadenosine tetraphosphate (Ap4A) HIT family hydrolase
MQDFSEQSIQDNCPHCNPGSQAFQEILENTGNFWIVCDSHPLCEGHILIIPKRHISCIGEYPSDLFREFEGIYDKVKKFLKNQYGSVATFEHGVLGQTIFHSHIHLLPFANEPEKIIPEKQEHLIPLKSLGELATIFRKSKGYLFFSINDRMWTVDPMLAAPRFFRDRFAQALGVQERENWKVFHNDAALMEIAKKENLSLKKKWMFWNKWNS